jgi:hypothetical protein
LDDILLEGFQVVVKNKKFVVPHQLGTLPDKRWARLPPDFASRRRVQA